MSFSASLRRAALAVFATAMAGIMVLTAPSLIESMEFAPIIGSREAGSAFEVAGGHSPQDIELQAGRRLLMLTTNLLVGGIGEGLMALIILYIVLVLSVSTAASTYFYASVKLFLPLLGCFWPLCGELVYCCNNLHAKMA
jgi:hypothetical protein